MTRRFILQQVSDALLRGASVLTPNERSARTLRVALATETGNAVSVLSFSAWAGAEWQRRIIAGVEDRTPLTAAQELRLWEETVAADTELETLLPSARLAEMAGEAAHLLYEWDARKKLQSQNTQGDPSVFLRWLLRFEKECARSQWIPNAALITNLAKAFQQSTLPLPPEIFLVGFDQLLPSQKTLLDALTASGVTVQFAEPAPIAKDSFLARCADLADEMKQCALWATEQVAQQRRVAIVHPDPAAVRPLLERSLREHVAIYMHDVSRTAAQAPYEFSLGVPLRSTTLVRHALLLLQWLSGPMDVEKVSEVLRSLYIGTETTTFARAEFDAFGLREEHGLRREISVNSVVALLREKRHNTERWPSLQEFASQLHQAAKLANLSAKAGWMGWADHVTTLLSTAGWGNARSDDSYEFQLRQRWRETLEDMARMQALGERVSWDTALRTLDALTTRTLFAPESHNAAIQIMGPHEAAGSEFDALWFLDADDIQWPPSANPCPLLPFALQRDAGMPGTDAEADIARFSTITERILRSADTTVVSYAAHTATGEEARCSHLFSDRELQTFPLAVIPSHAPEITLQKVNDTENVPSLVTKKFTGGASLLQAQAACSFRAFAERRLFAAEPGAVVDGLDAAERGNILHRILENFWRKVKSQEELIRISKPSTTERDRLLRNIISTAVAEEPTHPWERSYIQLEEERLLHLISRWLNIEMERPTFVVEDIEQKLEDISIGSLRLDLRVDRVDQVTTKDGTEGFLLIDYKTGKASPADWAGERPDAPQLPLYAAIATEEHVSGIAYANLQPGEKGIALHGVSGIPGMLGEKDKGSNFAEMVPEWRRILTVLADEFAEGHAVVGPKQFPATCRYCRQHLLCRVHASDALRDDDDIEEGERE